MCVPSTRDAVHVIVVIISYREEMPRGEHAIAAVFDDHPYRDQFDFDDRHVTIYEKEQKIVSTFFGRGPQWLYLHCPAAAYGHKNTIIRTYTQFLT